MKLYEYQSKQIFARYEIPIPRGAVAATPTEAKEIAGRFGRKVVVKSQVLAGGRNKAGGIKTANNPDEAQLQAERLLGAKVKGLTVQKVLVEEAADIEEEIYMAIVIDRTVRKPVLLVSVKGGLELEMIARQEPKAIMRLPIDPLLGLLDFQVRNLAFDLGLRRRSVVSFVKIAQRLYLAFSQCDATLVEIDPLMVTSDEKLIVVGAIMELDDNALFRHPDLIERDDLQAETETERQAYERGLSYIKLNGEIGCIVNGAGLAMATMDIINHYGGRPANFLDIGGGANADKVATALRIILSDPKVKAVLCNIFGGLTRCDEVARGILMALAEIKSNPPLVVRLAGTNETEGRAILAAANYTSTRSFREAAEKVVALAKGGAFI